MMPDTFTEGVLPGGLRNTSEIKLLICYILRNVNQPILADDLKNMLQYEGLANYFAVAQAISELEKANNIESLDAGLSVTPTGVKIARELELTLPITVRERAVNTAIRTLRLRKNAKENRVLIEPADGGYIVSCSVMDGEKELMTIRLLVGDGLQADRVKTQFLEEPLSVYAAALSVMTGDYSLFDIAKKDAKNNKNKL